MYNSKMTEHSDGSTELTVTDDDGNLIAFMHVHKNYINADFKADNFAAKKFKTRDDGTIDNSIDSRVDIGRTDANSFICVHTDA